MQGLSLAEGNALFNQGEFAESIHCYIKAAQVEELISSCEINISRAKLMRAKQKNAQNQSVAVAAWDLSHNAAGRAVTLLELYRFGGVSAELIGCVFKPERGIWPPVHYLSELTHSFNFGESECFLDDCLQFVLQHPYDIVHLSKPRIVNLVLGFIYKAVWGSKVIMDVDDEELAFIEEELPLSFAEFEAKSFASLPLDAAPWTQLAVGSVALFDAITVSNPALQAKYGGLIIPHVRNEAVFTKAVTHRLRVRASLGVTAEDRLLVFVGTARKHKGLLETAAALTQLNSKTIKFLIAGDFPDKNLKQQLQQFSNVEFLFVTGPSLEDMPALVSAGDICVLLQDPQSLVSQFQLPAKLIDALAAGLQVFITPTAATQHIVDAGAAVAVTSESLAEALKLYLQQDKPVNDTGSAYFSTHLSMAANWPQLNALLTKHVSASALNHNLKGVLKHLTFKPDIFSFVKQMALMVR
ncbi:glycosyltransferase [Rheinheimera mangrovi]|uniref:glycosyltransferase n=1 Tax=Rheinheimera mangrovi TaxID=2498451 RepID=UPI000F8E0030|nr:glycosyltransferase [Rheinheimera mangrovi]